MHTNSQILDYKIALLMGGNSTEREISLKSGEAIAKSLDDLGLEFERIDPSDEGDLKRLITGNYDLAFIGLHGKNGEDGAIQGLLQLLDIPFTGSDILSSALAMNKHQTKQIYREAGINSPKSVMLQRDSDFDLLALEREFSYPCVVKTLGGGSSIGVEIVRIRGSLALALDRAFEQSSQVMLEQHIEAPLNVNEAKSGSTEQFNDGWEIL